MVLSNDNYKDIIIKGYIIKKEIPVDIPALIQKQDPALALVISKYITAMRDNEIDGVLNVLKKPDSDSERNLVIMYNNLYIRESGVFPKKYRYFLNPQSVNISGNICYIVFQWENPDTGSLYSATMLFYYDGKRWWVSS